MEIGKEKKQKKMVKRRVVICMLILAAGWAGMDGLASLKTPPVEKKIAERALKVQATRVHPQDYPVTIAGFGAAAALTKVAIAPEVTGRVIYTHPALKTGRVIPRGEAMFRIDPIDYKAGRQEAAAAVSQWQDSIARLNKQFAIDAERLKTLQRNEQLAKSEFERVKRLFESHRIGARSEVDQAEQAFNSAKDQAAQMSQTVSLYPLQIREAESSLLSAKARLTVADTHLSRCTVKSPFNARIQSVALETGQFVTPGQIVLTLADDTVLEIQVPLDSRDARQWLQFEPSSDKHPPSAWFGNLKPVACTVRWTEDKAGSVWHGVLNRVVTFDQRMRTLTVAIRIDDASAQGGGDRALPLVDGMFCVVEIPGRVLRHVCRLPRQAVSFENKVYRVGPDMRLKTVAVSVVRVEGEYAYVDQGLKAGDRAIVTRLIDPLENSLLEIADTPIADTPAAKGAAS